MTKLFIKVPELKKKKNVIILNSEFLNKQNVYTKVYSEGTEGHFRLTV